MTNDFKMSPIASILIKILRGGSYGAAVLLALFAGILLWQRRLPDGSFDLSRQDISFLIVLAALAALAIYLVRAISKELKKPGG